MDIELSSHRTKPVSAKICAEKIDGHAARATEIMQRCLSEQREPTADEMAQFDEICDELIPAWRLEQNYATKYAKAIIATSQAGKNATWLGDADYGNEQFMDLYEWRNSRQ